jgi:hypothetical protein
VPFTFAVQLIANCSTGSLYAKWNDGCCPANERPAGTVELPVPGASIWSGVVMVNVPPDVNVKSPGRYFAAPLYFTFVTLPPGNGSACRARQSLDGSVAVIVPFAPVTPEDPEQLEDFHFAVKTVGPRSLRSNSAFGLILTLPVIAQLSVPCASTGTFAADAGPAVIANPLSPSAATLAPTKTFRNIVPPNLPTRALNLIRQKVSPVGTVCNDHDGNVRFFSHHFARPDQIGFAAARSWVRRLRMRANVVSLGDMRRGLRTAAAVAALVLASSACEGTWQKTSNPSPVRAVHAALLHTGKVLLIAGSGNDPGQFAAGSFKTGLYDPATDTLRSDVPTPYDLFCAGHAFLPDGRLLVAGGTAAYASDTIPYLGEARVSIFDPASETYQSAPSMAIGRWYPTIVSRGDGTFVTVAGFDDAGRHSNTFQVFDAATGTWSPNRPIGTWPSGIGVYSPLYPSMHLLANGQLFYSGAHVFAAGPNTPPYRWDVDANQVTWMENNAALNAQLRDQSASVLLPPAQAQKVMVIGGGLEGNTTISVASTAVIDLARPNPTYTAGPPIDAAKMYVSAVILPDGRVLQTGGATGYRMNSDSRFVRSTQILDPKTMQWAKAPDATVGRTYHSGALLLPDGRVLTFGGNPRDGSFEMNLEIYSPGYMTKPRPSISSAPVNVTYGGAFAVGTSEAIASAVLIRPSAVTHSSDSDQRSVDLAVSSATASSATLTVPGNRNLAPPGWYMLFVRNASGAPSVAKWVKVG